LSSQIRRNMLKIKRIWLRGKRRGKLMQTCLELTNWGERIMKRNLGDLYKGGVGGGESQRVERRKGRGGKKEKTIEFSPTEVFSFPVLITCTVDTQPLG